MRSIKPIVLRTCACILLAVAALPLIASPSNKWRIQASGKAKVAGEVELSFTPAGAAARSMVVAIPASTSENKAAHLIRDSIRATFGDAVYHAEVDDGEDVLVKARGSTPHFDLVIVRNTATGLRLSLDRE